jgi:hypothetical protein
VAMSLSRCKRRNRQALVIASCSSKHLVRIVSEVLSAVLLALFSSVTNASEPQPSADIRCVIIGMQMGNLPEISQRSAGSMMLMYYLGRLEIIAPELNVEESIVKELALMSPTDYQADSARCRKALSDKAHAVVLIGEHLVRRGSHPYDKQSSVP